MSGAYLRVGIPGVAQVLFVDFEKTADLAEFVPGNAATSFQAYGYGPSRRIVGIRSMCFQFDSRDGAFSVTPIRLRRTRFCARASVRIGSKSSHASSLRSIRRPPTSTSLRRPSFAALYRVVRLRPISRAASLKLMRSSGSIGQERHAHRTE